MEEIKACPFCGRTNVSINNSEFDGKIKWTLIHCCINRTGGFDNITSACATSLEDVVESWNRRVQE
jgi:hypothetical protein